MSDPASRTAFSGRTPANLQLRLREAADIRDLFELCSERSFQHFASGRPPHASVSDFEAWLNSLSPRRFEAVAVIDQRVIGLAGIYAFDGQHKHMGSLMLAVRENFQGQGIGRILMTALTMASDFCLGLHRLQLNVFSDNERAIRIYHDFGFEIEGRHRDFLRRRDGYVDAFTMSRFRNSALDALSTTEINKRIRAALSSDGHRPRKSASDWDATSPQ